MQFASLRLVAQGTRCSVSHLVTKSLGTSPLPTAASQRECGPGQDNWSWHSLLPRPPPAKLSSRLLGCVQPKERGGCPLGSPREQTAPARPHTPLVEKASKAITIFAFLSGFSEVQVMLMVYGTGSCFRKEQYPIWVGYTQRFSAIFLFLQKPLSISLMFSVKEKQTPMSPLASRYTH